MNNYFFNKGRLGGKKKDNEKKGRRKKDWRKKDDESVPDSGDLNQEPRNTFLLTFAKITKYNYIKVWANLSLLKSKSKSFPKSNLTQIMIHNITRTP